MNPNIEVKAEDSKGQGYTTPSGIYLNGSKRTGIKGFVANYPSVLRDAWIVGALLVSIGDMFATGLILGILVVTKVIDFLQEKFSA